MSPRLEHGTLVYGSEEEFLATAVPFVREGIANRDGNVVATTEHNWRILAGALGSDADAVLFVSSSDVYRSPVAAVAAYDNVITQFKRQGYTSVRAIGEVLYGDVETWLPYEPIAHGVFQDAALTVICPYDTRVLPERLVEHARRTHPHVYAGTDRSPSAEFVDPFEILRVHPARVSFEPQRAPDFTATVSSGDPGPARRAVAEEMERALPLERADEAMVAIAETMANGLRHGQGQVTANVWTLPEAVVCSVRNDGPPITDLLAGYRPPSDPEHGGMGLWIARQLADELEIGHDDRGPVVTLAFVR